MLRYSSKRLVSIYRLGCFGSIMATITNGMSDVCISDMANKKSKMTEPLCKRPRENNDMQAFDQLFVTLVDDLSKYGMKDPEIGDAIKWFKDVNDYNVPHGKKNRGLTVLHSYRYLAKEKSTAEDEELACVLGWCIEWLQAYFLVADDMMDGSHTRRGQPCWYKKPGVDMIAINDSFYLESAIYVILKKYFKSKPYYVDILELFHETTLQTVIGQNLDLITAPTDRVDFTNYTMDRYKAIVKWKTAFYSFYLPVACAMYMVGISDPQSHANAKTILLKMGEFFQIQDDYLDCYGDPAITGKIGTDIEDNKCGWMVIQALNRVDKAQRQLLEANYAQNDPEKVRKVKSLFDELNLKQVYRDYEESSYNELTGLIDTLSGSLPKEMFVSYAKKIYKRQK
ncbi:hypothetical protein CAPTEDRAFT_223258 [Capitella teleta]|uniref:Farnesyl pyrophosphate synthase n=1 Tax=Capitella teleta TaxID=283909 RepID=R7ULH5_CAPTE|nr:hypothetical protein CAPTEDRAFT_223258 [Capitella teleta]|eukprot:ELU07394.1 hypothetical protein CAPTEDRAFT_223258 [Capitella teleta]